MKSRQWTAWSVLILAIGMSGFAQSELKKISYAEAKAAVQSRVQPEYPPMAKQLKVQGEVELEALVGEDGAVEKVNIVSGNAVLTKPAAEALKKWKFKPFTADGKPVKVLAPIRIGFSIV